MRRQGRSVSPLWSAVAGSAVVSGLIGLAALTGCQPPPKPPPPAPSAPAVATPEQAAMTQQQLMSIDPRARVGQVDGVRADMHECAVKGIPASDIRIGDTVSFQGGSDAKPYAVGQVTMMSDPDPTRPVAGKQFPIIDYQKSASGGRDPVDGDMAIMVPLGH